MNDIMLPEIITKGTISLEEALAKRRSIRNYTNEPLTLQEVSQLLWSTQGITEPESGHRTAPSAGGIYPLEIFIEVPKNGAKDLTGGVYRYIPEYHKLILVKSGDHNFSLSEAARDQESVLDAKLNIVIAAVYERTTRRYGERGIRYVHMEVGHVGQNVSLQATALNLGMVVIGAFNDDQVQKVIGMKEDEKPQYILSVGRLEQEF